MTFRKWLAGQTKRQDAVGDFARDTRRIIRYPTLYGAFPKEPVTFSEIESFMHSMNASDMAIAAALRAWQEFERAKQAAVDSKHAQPELKI